MNRSSGVLAHISSLPGDHSIGSFGAKAREFIDFAASCGFSYWQTLPFCMIDECNSPYKSFSAFAGNPYFIDLPTLCEQGLITKEELDAARQQSPWTSEYARLTKERLPLLFRAAGRADGQLRSKTAEFMASRRRLADACRFMALKTANGEKAWNEWTVTDCPESDVFAWEFIQYEFFTQWAEIRKYAAKKNIKIIGDIPIYVAYDSSDVYFDKEQFLLNSDGSPSGVAGVPPDYFAKDGQLWGNPLYDWEYMEKDGFSWWRDRLRTQFELFDGVRIDHFRGIASYWCVPGDAKTAKEGSWKKGPGEAFVDMLREEADGRLIIAEDLGDITEDVVELLEYSGFPGMRVLQFGFLDDGDSTHKPHHYCNNCVAYTGTHDNDTLLGYIWSLPEGRRREVLEYCGFLKEDWSDCYGSIIRTVFASSAGLVVFPVQDLLGYGTDTRMNTPGTSSGNWEYRFTSDQLRTIDTEKYRRLNRLYRRH